MVRRYACGLDVHLRLIFDTFLCFELKTLTKAGGHKFIEFACYYYFFSHFMSTYLRIKVSHLYVIFI